jgi:Fe-S-cluster containining protein
MMKNGERPRDHCIRCGECCLGSSPTLQMEDAPLVREGYIRKGDLYSIRVGEPVRDNIENRLIITDRELIKVRDKKDGSGCIYYDGEAKACNIYDHRPAQCAALKCWDSTEFMKVYKRPKADRKAIVYEEVLLALIEEHGTKCSYGKLDGLVRIIEKKGNEAVERILEMLKFDHHVRNLTAKKLGIDFGEMDFYFGRPLTETITMFGLQVIREPDGSFFLTLLDENGA